MERPFPFAVDAHTPKTKVKISYKPPYITKDIIHALNMKETIRKRAKSTNSPPSGIAFASYAVK
jgi:butyrate kinase